MTVSVTRPVTAAAAQESRPAGPHVVVLGNEKGGTGKSTTAMHLTVAILRAGATVGLLDLDARQGTTTRYAANRAAYAARHGLDLPMPEVRAVHRSGDEADEERRFRIAFDELAGRSDVIVIDTPGSDNTLSRLGHSFADTLVTPMNDSFIDLDLLATVDPDTLDIRSPSTYAAMVWEQRQRRALDRTNERYRRPIDWVVMRNRLSAIDARNKREMADLLDRLAKRIRFRVAPGFGERVIFRELFLKGLTLLDLRDADLDHGMTMSHVAARQEVRNLIAAIGLDRLTGESVSQT